MSKIIPARLLAALSGLVLALAGAFALAASPASPASAATTQHCERYVFYPSGQSLCDKFPGNADRDCDDINVKVALISATVDPWHLDGNGQAKGNGMGCETKPDCPYPYPTATHPSTKPTTKPTTTSPTTPPTTTPGTTAPTTTVPPTTEPTDEPTTATATASETQATAAPGESLPLTGPGAPVFAAVAVLLVLAGVGVLVWARRRRTTRFAA